MFLIYRTTQNDGAQPLYKALQNATPNQIVDMQQISKVNNPLDLIDWMLLNNPSNMSIRITNCGNGISAFFVN